MYIKIFTDFSPLSNLLLESSEIIGSYASGSSPWLSVRCQQLCALFTVHCLLLGKHASLW